MFKRRDEAENLCVLQVSTEARFIEGAVLTDRNASSAWVRFLSIKQVHLLDLNAIYAADWRHPNNSMAYRHHKSLKCAEFLVPHVLPPRFLTGAYVVNKDSLSALQRSGFNLPITVDPDLFFH